MPQVRTSDTRPQCRADHRSGPCHIRPGCVEVVRLTRWWAVPIVDRVRQVPVPGGTHEREVFVMKVEESRYACGDFSTTRHREAATLDEVVLNINDQECGLHGHAPRAVKELPVSSEPRPDCKWLPESFTSMVYPSRLPPE